MVAISGGHTRSSLRSVASFVEPIKGSSPTKRNPVELVWQIGLALEGVYGAA